jgi:hypothetical protein
MGTHRARRALSWKTRWRRLSGTTTDLYKRLDNIESDTKLRMATELAVEYLKSARYYHTEYINKYNTPSFITDDERYTLVKHSHFRGSSASKENRGWIYSRLFNPFGTMSTAMHTGQTTKKNGSVKIHISGADIVYQEYGTGRLGKLYPHPNAGKRGWHYGTGPFEQDDRETGIRYWVYGQYARIGNPAGHFLYDAINDTLESAELQDKLRDELTKYGKESIVTMFSEAFYNK